MCFVPSNRSPFFSPISSCSAFGGVGHTNMRVLGFPQSLQRLLPWLLSRVFFASRTVVVMVEGTTARASMHAATTEVSACEERDTRSAVDEAAV
jgi:hypothetical protein